jgi:hypothetical protein
MTQNEAERPPANRRTFEAIAEAEALGNQLKRATVKGREIISDESVSFGGSGSAPGAMDYFVAAVLF